MTVAEAVVQSYSSTSNSVIMLSDDSEDALSDEDDDSSLRSRGRVNSHTMFVQWVAQWLACVHTLLEEDSDRSPVTVGKLKKTRIIPLTNGAQVAAEDGSLFFPFDGASGKFTQSLTVLSPRHLSITEPDALSIKPCTLRMSATPSCYQVQCNHIISA